MFDSEVSFCLLHDDVMSLLQVLVLIVQRLQLAVCRLQLLRQPDSDQRPSKHSAVTMGVYVPLKPTKQMFPISAPSLLPLLPREGGEMGVLNRHLRLHNDVSRATFLFFCIFQIIMYFAFYSSVYKSERTELPFLSYRWQTSFIIWSHLSPTGKHTCFAGTATVNRSPYQHSSRCWLEAPAGSSTKKLAATSGRRHWPICWCCLDRGLGSFDVEDATTLSWSSTAVSEWVSVHKGALCHLLMDWICMIPGTVTVACRLTIPSQKLPWSNARHCPRMDAPDILVFTMPLKAMHSLDPRLYVYTLSVALSRIVRDEIFATPDTRSACYRSVLVQLCCHLPALNLQLLPNYFSLLVVYTSTGRLTCYCRVSAGRLRCELVRRWAVRRPAAAATPPRSPHQLALTPSHHYSIVANFERISFSIISITLIDRSSATNRNSRNSII